MKLLDLDRHAAARSVRAHRKLAARDDSSPPTPHLPLPRSGRTGGSAAAPTPPPASRRWSPSPPRWLRRPRPTPPPARPRPRGSSSGPRSDTVRPVIRRHVAIEDAMALLESDATKAATGATQINRHRRCAAQHPGAPDDGHATPASRLAAATAAACSPPRPRCPRRGLSPPRPRRRGQQRGEARAELAQSRVMLAQAPDLARAGDRQQAYAVERLPRPLRVRGGSAPSQEPEPHARPGVPVRDAAQRHQGRGAGVEARGGRARHPERPRQCAALPVERRSRGAAAGVHVLVQHPLPGGRRGGAADRHPARLARCGTREGLPQAAHLGHRRRAVRDGPDLGPSRRRARHRTGQPGAATSRRTAVSSRRGSSFWRLARPSTG